MRKILFALSLLIFAPNCFAQQTLKYPELQKKLFTCNGGMFCALRDSAQYFIYSLESLTQKEIFHKMILALNDSYVDFDKVVSKIENEAITVNGYSLIKEPNVFTIGDEPNSLVYELIGINYRFSFKIKDGKMRVEAPYISNVDYYFDTIHSKIRKSDSLTNLSSKSKSYTLDYIIEKTVASILQNIFKNMSLPLHRQNDDW